LTAGTPTPGPPVPDRDTGGVEPPTDGLAAPAPDQGAAAGSLSDLDASPQASSGLALRDGLALTVAEAHAMAAGEGVRIVMPLGPVKVGKTTLAVEIYDRYLRFLEWADASFCASRSLLDFEMLAFPSRLNSEAGVPETWRTRLSETRYLLHLELLKDRGGRNNLLIANQSGELSEHVRDGEDPATELPLLARADRILICVDGASIAHGALSGRAVSDTRQLIGTLNERASLLPAARAALVLTKLDVVSQAGHLERWRQAEGDLVACLDALGRGAQTFRVAARTEDEPEDNQFEELVTWLLSDGPFTDAAKPEAHRAVRSISRQGNIE
jgi:Double-GTPase 2